MVAGSKTVTSAAIPGRRIPRSERPTRAAERDDDAPSEPLGWKLKMTHLIAQGSFHGLIRLEDGRLYPISRDGGEDVFKSSWVTFSR